MEGNKFSGLTKAIKLAHDVVLKLGYTHQKLVDMDLQFNFNTLRRISDGQQGKRNTDLYYLSKFVSILYDKYWEYIKKGADTDKANYILRIMMNILLLILGIPTKGE